MEHKRKTYKYNTVIILGAPCSGKGTICEQLVKIVGTLKHISTGNILRMSHAYSDLDTNNASKIADGGLLDDKTMMKMLINYINGLRATFIFNLSTDTLLLDGVPRTENQLIQLQEMASIKLAIVLNASTDTLKTRLNKRSNIMNRDDDKEEAFYKRLEIYHSISNKMLSKIDPNIVTHIDANHGVLKTLSSVIASLSNILELSS